jgi:hypothetical protein
MMSRRFAFAGTCLFVALLALPFGADATDWWGRKLPNPPTQFIFGYGSLINTPSRNSTAAAPIPAIPVRVSAAFGFIRTWNDRSPSGFTALGLRKPHDGEKASTINGVLYAVDGDDMAKFDAREEGYARVEVPHEDIEAVSWQSVPAAGHIWVYVPVRPGGEPGVGLPEPDAAFPMLESYIDVVVEGGLEYGPDFAREIIETTADWSEFWLNDRELARRPWVHDVKSGAVDKLLATTAPASARLGARLFAEPYAVKWPVGTGK